MAFESDSSNSETSYDYYSIYDLDIEPENEYCKDGFMKIPENAVIAERYTVIQKLGWGHGGVVFLCRDKTENSYKALKVFKSHRFYRQEFKDEVKILEKIYSVSDGLYTVRLLDHFKIVGEYGSHTCAIYELLGVSLYEIMKYYKFKGLPLQLCKFISIQILQALAYFHENCGIFIGDVRLKNILLQMTAAQLNSLEENGIIREKLDLAVFKHTNTPYKILNKVLGCNFPIDNPNKPKKSKPKPKKSQKSSRKTLKELNKLGLINEEFLIKFINLGSACELSENCIREIPSLNYRPPEILLKMQYTSAIDMWSLGCLLFELVTGDNLFEPIKGKGYKKEDDLFAQMIEMLGQIPLEFLKESAVFARYFEEDGRLRCVKMLRDWPLKFVLIEKYGIVHDEAEALADFFKQLLSYVPSQRISARDALKHPWLKMASKDDFYIPKDKLNNITKLLEEREKKYWETCLKGHDYVFPGPLSLQIYK
jgi:serine/threonine-protein kinase SRPK3